jgi:hypothetical protein
VKRSLRCARARSSAFAGVALALLLVACSAGPSKSQAFEAIQAGVKEDGRCTLPVGILTQLKMQHTSKGICVPKEGAAQARKCIDALIAANVTRKMPDAYMLTWPDEVSAASLSDVPAYDRHSRELTYSICVELVDGMREGRFNCAAVNAENVLKVTASDDTHAEVRYERTIMLRPTLAAIDAACGTTTRPPGEATVKFVKGPSGWVLAPAVDEAAR